MTILLAEHRLERCLALRRPRARAARRTPRARRLPGIVPWLGRARGSPRCKLPVRALFALAGFAPPPVGVKQARASLRARRLLSSEPVSSPAPPAALHINMGNRRQGAPSSGPPPHTCTQASIRGRRRPALQLRGVWHELRHGPAILRGAELHCGGESVALMGRTARASPRCCVTPPASSSPPAGGTSAAGSRCCCRTPATTSSTSASRDEASPRRSRRGLARARRAQPPRPLRRRAPAPGARDRLRRRGGRRPRCWRWTSPRAAWTATRRRNWRGAAPPRRGGPAVIVATHDPESPAPAPSARCCWPTAGDRRRPRASCWPAAGTSPPKPPASSVAPGARSRLSRGRELLPSALA